MIRMPRNMQLSQQNPNYVETSRDGMKNSTNRFKIKNEKCTCKLYVQLHLCIDHVLLQGGSNMTGTNCD